MIRASSNKQHICLNGYQNNNKNLTVYWNAIGADENAMSNKQLLKLKKI